MAEQILTQTETLTNIEIKGNLASGLKNTLIVRDLPEFYIDEPKELGGTDLGANPVEYHLAALTACNTITFATVASEQNFSYKNIDYKTDGDLDIRGFLGVEGVPTYFQNINIVLEIETDESEAAIENLKVAVEKRCPLYNLSKDAGIEIISEWIKK